MEKKLQVFVSSTYVDMKEERQAAVAAILKAGHIPAGMELFAAGDQSQWDTIKRWIDDSDIYMLILGGRYGSIEETSGKSYIELEFDYAVEKGKPLFSVVIDNEALEKKIKENGSSVIEKDQPQKLNNLHTKVLRHMCAFFSDPKDIRLAIYESIPDLSSRNNCVGWISGKRIQDMDIVSDEVKRLREENAALRNELEAEKSRVEKKYRAEKNGDLSEADAKELISILSKIEIDPAPYGVKGENGKLLGKLSVFQVLGSVGNTLINGIYNKVGMSNAEKFIFFEAVPKLQIHELATTEKVSGARYRRAYLTRKGEQLLAYLERRKIAAKSQTSSPTKGSLVASSDKTEKNPLSQRRRPVPGTKTEVQLISNSAARKASALSGYDGAYELPASPTRPLPVAPFRRARMKFPGSL